VWALSAARHKDCAGLKSIPVSVKFIQPRIECMRNSFCTEVLVLDVFFFLYYMSCFALFHGFNILYLNSQTEGLASCQLFPHKRCLCGSGDGTALSTAGALSSLWTPSFIVTNMFNSSGQVSHDESFA